MMCAIKGEMRIIFLTLLVASMVTIANGEDKTVRLDDFNAEIVVPKQAIASSRKGNKAGGEKVYYFDLKDMSWAGANITVMDQPAPSTMTQYKMDAINAYKQIKATVNHCEISRDGKQFTLDVGDVVMLNRRMRFFQKAILNGDKLILATGGYPSDMSESEIGIVKNATFSLRLVLNKKLSMSESEKELTLKQAIKGINGSIWNTMGPERGFTLLKSLAEDGYAPAQVELGHIYSFGKQPLKGKKDIKQAVYWYSKAASQGNAEAQNSLGVCYEQGNGVKKDISRALQLYQQAAKGGDAFAAFNLGVYNEKIGRLHEAKHYYLNAAAKEHPTAMYNLGMIYYEGKGVPKDIKEAVYWFERASVLDEPLAQNNLGWILARGESGPVDTERAVELFKKAAAKGVENAKKSLEYIKKHGSLLQ